VKNRTSYPLLIIIACLFIAPFNSFAQADESESEPPEEGAADFTVSFARTNISFNPLHSYTATEAQIYSAIFEGLATYHPLTMEPLPGAAYKWEISPDKRIYRFYLRENGKYWNGDPVTAFDFKNSWLKLLAPEEKSEYSFLLDVIKNAKDYRTGKLEQPDSVGIYAAGPYTLDIELEQPADHFLKILCHHSFVPIHPQFLKVEDWKNTNIIPGNGPYYVYSQSSTGITLVKNRLYWDAGSVAFDRVRVDLHDDSSQNTLRFNEGELQWVTDGIILDQVEKIEAIVTNPLFATNYFFFNCALSPWNDPKVRRGLALLLPWRQIRSTQFIFIPANHLVPALPYYPDIEGISEVQTEEGLKLLAEAGYPEGKGLPAVIIKTPGSFEGRRIGQLMQHAWSEQLSLEVEIKEYEYGNYYQELKTGDYTLGTISWIGDFPDPLTFLQMWTTDSNLNDAGYSSEIFDGIIDQSMTETGKERYAILSQAEEMLLHDAVVLPINHLPAWNLIDLTETGGWYPNPLDIHPFKYIQKRKLQIDPWIVMDDSPF